MRNMNEEVKELSPRMLSRLQVLASLGFSTRSDEKTVAKIKIMVNAESGFIVYALNKLDEEYIQLLIADIEEVEKVEIDYAEEGKELGRKADEYLRTHIGDDREMFFKRFATFSAPQVLWEVFEDFEKVAQASTELANLLQSLEDDDCGGCEDCDCCR